VSYIDGIYEIMHDSQSDAIKYLRHIGYKKANNSEICTALKAQNDNKILTRYDRIWKCVD
jgi:hypothetical protein